MKLKYLTVATMSALYAAGVCATVQSDQAGSWKALEISPEQLAEKVSHSKERAKQESGLNPRARLGATNRLIKRKGADEKFKPEPNLEGEHVYIIQLKDQPVATYQGGLAGFPATSLSGQKSWNASTQGVASSQKLFGNAKAASTHVQAYRSHLFEQQDQFVQQANALGVPLKVQQQFTVTLNAVTATLSQKQAAALARSESVLNIQRSVMHELDTDVGPQTINADTVWSGEGSHDGMPYKGEGQIVGVIDTGINSDHVAFADVGDDGYDHENPLGTGNYLGQCNEEAFKDRCNDKLIGVYTWDKITEMYSSVYFQEGYPENPPQWEWDFEEIRPKFGEDYNGHGSHTASTAAGNVINAAPLQLPSYDMDPEEMGNTGDGRDTGLTRKVSGVAPHANVVMYQACYGGDGRTSPYWGCPTEATLASIEQAVLDGVDVINYSISGWGFPWDDAIEQAFYSAFAAGISVAASAGNGGFSSPTNHNSPWLLSVAATHHGRTFAVEEKTLSSFSGGDSTPDEISGASISGGMTGYIVTGESAGDETCDTAFAANTFTADQIVMCQRSDQPRIDKAQNVLDAGAGGFILYNKDSWGTYGSLVQDMYPLPSIHISKNDGNDLLAWLETGTGHMATINAAEAYAEHDESMANLVARFTSAAENPTFDGTLTPSIAAPGVDVFAAWADDQPFSANPDAMDWSWISGTSMASPHVAGAMALVRQAHPEWSVAQVQSALQMTSMNNLDDGSGDDPFFRGGAGLANVSAAINTGLIMDETAENMALANPQNGGDTTSLNLPALVNTECQTRCSWLRTVTATKDGTWTVTAAPNHDPVSINITASPSQFSLKAGETQAVVVTAEILDATARVGNTEDSYLFGDVAFTAAESDIPDVHWPVKMRFSRNNMPQLLRINAHANEGKYTLKNVPAEKVAQLSGQAFVASKPIINTLALEQDSDWTSPIFDTDMDGTATFWIDVPMGAKRLYAETLERLGTTAVNSYEAGDADIFIGIDSNGDGEINFADEAICWSYSETEKDFCSISDPAPGKYWIVYHAYRGANYDGVVDTYKFGHGYVTDEIAGDISISTPTAIDATTQMVDVEVSWNIDEFAQGDHLFTAIQLGTSDADQGNLGMFPVNIMRGQDAVNMQTSQTQAKAGDTVTVAIDVLANDSGADRDFALNATLPMGMQLVEGSVRVNNSNYISSDVQVEGQQITIAGQQLNTLEMQRYYNITTNANDAMCRMPLSATGGYLDLEAEYGFTPSFGGAWNETVRWDFKDFFPTEETAFAPYHNSEEMPYSSVNISPQGYLQFDEMPKFWADHFPFHRDNIFYGGIPDVMIAPMLRGGAFDGSLNTPLYIKPWWDNAGESTGITVVYNDSPKAIMVEWDNAQTQSFTWNPDGGEWASWGDSYDFQTYVQLEYGFGDNEYEIVMAYDNLTFADENNLPVTPFLMGVHDASIGLYGFHGPRGTFGPTYGALADQFHYGDIRDALSDGLVVCYDYVGPEVSQFTVEFDVVVDNNATGSDLMIELQSDLGGATLASSKMVSAPGNITLVGFNDQSIAENATLSGLEVVYHDKDNVSNTITVTGDNITAVVNGHTSGSTVDITPDANFHGDTTVTVTVADINFPNDMQTTSFNLTVVSDGIELGCTDSTATNYDATANSDDGSCQYPVAATPPPAVKSSSGSMFYLMLSSLLLMFRFRK